MMIRGRNLNPDQRAQVLAVFTYRWTHENAHFRYGGECPACVQSNDPTFHQRHTPLISDDTWLRGRKFNFSRDGARLSQGGCCELDDTEVPIVHALWHGMPLCRFTRDVPKFWPEGHMWVHPDSDEQTCLVCKEESKKFREAQVHQ